MDLEAFIITNGRSTFEYALKALQQQTFKFKITILRDMKWVDALNECLNRSSASHFIRCDDDFVLHPRAIEFMWNRYQTVSKLKTIMLVAKLWEDWTSRIAGGVKIYNAEFVKDIGGFKVNHLGKVDKKFREQVQETNYRMDGCKKSVVGLHTCGSWEEQLRYETLWSKLADHAYKKTTHNDMKKYKKPLDEQFAMRTKFVEKINKRYRTFFHEFLKK